MASVRYRLATDATPRRLAKRGVTHDIAIADRVHSIREIVEGPRKSKSRRIGFTVDIEDAKK